MSKSKLGCGGRIARIVRRFGWSAGIAFAVFGVSTVPDARQGSIERSMYVSVLDEDRTPVVGLTVEDFRVREDGVAREVLRVARATSPFSIAVLVDTSAAATPNILDIRAGVAAFVEAMAGDNEIAIITFGDRPTILQEYTRSALELQQSIKRIFQAPFSGAYSVDAAYDAARGLERQGAERPVIVLISTEGIDYSNRYHELVLDTLEEASIQLHAVVLTQRGGAFMRDDVRNRNDLLDLGTSRTGGRRVDLLRAEELQQTLTALAEELRNQYLLVYARPDALVPPERTELEMRQSSLTVRGVPVRGQP